MSTKMGRYRYWGDQKPDTGRPLLTVTRPREAVAAAARVGEAAQSKMTGTLRIYGPIDSWGGYWGVSAKEVSQALDLLEGAEQIIVRVNSPGGESAEGRAIVSLLRAHSAKTVTVVDGAAYSAASYIAICGDQSVMSPGTTLMIHDTSTYLYGNADSMRKAADILDVLSNSGAELYAEIAGGTVEEWRDRQRAESWYTAESAVASGLMQRVGNVADAGDAETAGSQGPESVQSGDVEERAHAGYDLSLFDKPSKGPKPPTASAEGSTHTEGVSVVSLSDQAVTNLRTKLGIAEDADEATILAALDEALDERAEPGSATATGVPTGHVVVPEVRLTDLESAAQAGAGAAKELHAMKRDAFLDEHKAKYPATSRAKWGERYDANADATRELLAGATDLIPSSEHGHGDAPDDTDGPTTLAQVRENPDYKNWEI